MTERNGPLPPKAVLIELPDAEPAAPEAAAPVPDTAEPVPPPAMARAARMMARGGGGLSRAFWLVAVALAGLILSLAAWDWVTRLLASAPMLGVIASVLMVALVAILLVAALREGLAILRLARLDGLQREASAALLRNDLPLARDLAGRLGRLYSGRAEMVGPVARLSDLTGDQFDAASVLDLAENVLLAPLDTAAQREIEAAARQVAAVTAVVPLAFADVAVALASNLRMIRRIAEIYGGRSGTFGSWRLVRSVMSHLVATGAVAVGDDLIGSVAGGSVLAKLSRRFGEGMVNGALTARVGVAAMEVCRPLPFRVRERPLVTTMLRRAVTGLFGKD